MSESLIYSLIIATLILVAYLNLKKLVISRVIEVRYSFTLLSRETAGDMGKLSIEPDSPCLIQEVTQTVNSLIIPSKGMEYISDGLEKPLGIITVVIAPSRAYVNCEDLKIDFADGENRLKQLEKCGWQVTPDWEIEHRVTSGHYYT